MSEHAHSWAFVPPWRYAAHGMSMVTFSTPLRYSAPPLFGAMVCTAPACGASRGATHEELDAYLRGDVPDIVAVIWNECVGKDTPRVIPATPHDLTGRRFGRWRVLREAVRHRYAGRGRWWRVQCECGAVRTVRTADLVAGRTKGCRKCYRTRGAPTNRP